MATAKDKLIAVAQKLVEKGQFEKAIKEYLKVVQTDDKDVRIWLKIGDLYAKLGKKPEATETYQKVAEFYSEQGFYLKSVAVYKQILKLDPRLVDVNQRLAELYKQLGLLSDAMQQYEAVAAFHHKEGKTREALAALKQIVELDPETVANRIKLAELYSKEQMPREAIDEFTRAAEQLKEQGRNDDYMKVAERLLFHSPDNRVVSKELARLYIEKGDPRRALPKLQVCFKADPRDTEVLGLLAKAFEALEQRAKAVSVLKELARILGENGDRHARDDVFRKILVLQPGDPDAEAALGQAPARKPTEPGLRVSMMMPAVNETGGSRPLTSGSFPLPGPPGKGSGAQPAARQTGGQPARSTGAQPAQEPRRNDSFEDDSPTAGPQPPTAVGKLLDANATGTAAALGDGEEIARILNETDVYIKYKLYAKAIEHVQRVFEYDPKHVEAREKLKALYLTVGKKDEAILELWSLAQQAEPGRQRRYLREILELDPSHAQAAELLGEEPKPGEKAQRSAQGGSLLGAVSDDSDEESLDVEALEELGDDEFDVAEQSGQIELPEMVEAEGTFSEPIAAPMASADSDDSLRVVDDPGSDDDLIPLVVDPAAAESDANGESESVEDRFGFSDEPAEPVDDRFSLGAEDPAPEDTEEPDLTPPPVTSGEGTKVPLSPLVPMGGQTGVRNFGRGESSGDHDVRTRFDEAAVKQLLAQETGLFGGSDEVDEADLPSVSDLKLPRGTATVPAASLPRSLQATPVPSTLPESARQKDSGNSPTPQPVREPTRPQAAPEGGPSLEDDLDEADFFIQQSLFDEARGILETLLERHPGHPLVTAKLRDLNALASGDGNGVVEEEVVPETNGPAQSFADLSAELPSDLPSDAHGLGDGTVEAPSLADEPAVELTKKGVIEKGVTAEDYETHYDLGIAYKEMGLLDDAITEFKLVMKDPAREVQCHLMIGLCSLEKGQTTEAIGSFKKGLYVEGISERESLSLYFELGQAYERLQDTREALYYYDKVLKRDPRFRNVERVVEALRSGAHPVEGRPQPGADDVDAAFDGLLGGEGTH